MEISVYGVRDGKTLFYSRAHQMKLQLEKDYGIYAHSAVKKEVLIHGDRYTRACDSFGYEFDVNGLSRTAPAGSGMAHAFQTKVMEVLAEKYPLSGSLTTVGNKTNHLLNLESFKYYLQMPAYIYPKNEVIARFGFLTFVMNSIHCFDIFSKGLKLSSSIAISLKAISHSSFYRPSAVKTIVTHLCVNSSCLFLISCLLL